MTQRLELRPDAYWVAVDGGVYVLGNAGPAQLTGRSIAQWMEWLAPHLDGSSTMEDLVRGVAPQRREMIERVVAALRSRDLVRVRVAQPQTQHSYETAYVDYFRDSAAQAVAGYRAATAVVVGSGPLVPALVRAARRSGLPPPSILELSSPESGRIGLDNSKIDGESAGVVFHLVGDATPEQVRQVERDCAEAGTLLAQVAVGADGEVWLAPAGDAASPRWSAALPRLRPGTPLVGADLSGSPAAQTLVAARLVQGAFRVLTGVAAAAAPDRLIRVDPGTLVSAEHRFLPHPLAQPAAAPTEAEFRARVAALAGGERLTEEAVSQRVAGCVDDRFGILTLREHDWTQSPLHVTHATVHGGRAGIDEIGEGFTYRSARVRAAMRGLARYGALAVDPRRLTGGSALGYEIADPHRVRLVPAELAFPPGYAPGLAAGFDWQEAVRDGLLGCCLRLTLAELEDAATPYPRLDLAAVEMDPDGVRCRDLIAAAGEQPEVYDITGTLGVPCIACCLGPDTVTTTAGLTAAAAVAAGLLAALRTVQARLSGQPAFAPLPGPALPPQLRGSAGSLPDVDEWDSERLARRLRQTGREPVAVPLDHDPSVAELMPYLVHVVLR